MQETKMNIIMPATGERAREIYLQKGARTLQLGLEESRAVYTKDNRDFWSQATVQYRSGGTSGRKGAV